MALPLLMPVRYKVIIAVAVDVYKRQAKHIPADKDGVRIAELDEQSYRYLLWNHRPLTDFWMTGPGTVKRLEAHGIYTCLLYTSRCV